MDHKKTPIPDPAVPRDKSVNLNPKVMLSPRVAELDHRYHSQTQKELSGTENESGDRLHASATATGCYPRPKKIQAAAGLELGKEKLDGGDSDMDDSAKIVKEYLDNAFKRMVQNVNVLSRNL